MIEIWVVAIVLLCVIVGWALSVYAINKENNIVVGELNSIIKQSNDEIELKNDRITDLENHIEIEKISNDSLMDKNHDLERSVNKLNESIDSLMDENHQLHAAVYKPRKCPFCGGDVDIEVNKGSVKRAYVKHKKHMPDCPLNEGFAMAAINRLDAVTKWNTRVCG